MVGVQDVVVDLGVDVFGVYKEAVYVEDTGADGGEVGGGGFGGGHVGFRDLCSVRFISTIRDCMERDWLEIEIVRQLWIRCGLCHYTAS